MTDKPKKPSTNRRAKAAREKRARKKGEAAENRANEQRGGEQLKPEEIWPNYPHMNSTTGAINLKALLEFSAALGQAAAGSLMPQRY